jgi:S-adenosylmethionine decarboxylase
VSALGATAPFAPERFAPRGAHWLIDCHGVDAALLADAVRLEALLRDAAFEAGARILSSHFHRFGADAASGVTGVVVLAESHITIHTWPERRFAAIDLFLCGATQPARALARIERELAPTRTVTTRCERGE